MSDDPELAAIREWDSGTSDTKALLDVYRHRRTLLRRLDASAAEFKNFHRLLCERFGYEHDEIDWRRDQLSLIEFIAARVPIPATASETTGGEHG